MNIQTVILAAGQGTRMKSAMPKVLHKIGPYPLLEHVYRLASKLGDRISIVYGHGGDRVKTELAHFDANWVRQEQQLGTGHAVMQVTDWIDDQATVLILYGDVPMLQEETVRLLINACESSEVALLTVELEDPFGYGRIIRDQQSRVLRSVEEKDATPEQRMICEVNTGVLAVNGKRLKRWLRMLGNKNAQQEYYLTDVIELAVRDGLNVNTVSPMFEDEVLGINNRNQLGYLERKYQFMLASRMMEAGVTLRDPYRIDVRGEVETLGQDIEIDINVLIEGPVNLGDRVRIGANCCIINSVIGDDVEILPNSIIENSVAGQGCRIGPFARIRPDTRLSDHVHVGNFVEVKKSSVASGTKINHLSYIGDSAIGERVNIGAGTITCNYDGANKYQTVIEDDVFLGSDTQLIAPVRIGKNATVGAGSTISRDAPENQLTLSRSKQFSVPGWQRPVKRR